MRVNGMIVDLHTHILPGMDDGSKSPQESVAMLETCMKSGVDAVLLTPHFYAQKESISMFCTRREKAWTRLLQSLPEEHPQLALAAETRYFEGITQTDELERLCHGRYLLLEMPFDSWGRRIVQEVEMLPVLRGITPILVHIERYAHVMHSAQGLETLRRAGCLMQMNTEAFTGLLSGRKNRALLRQGVADVLGSDCHNCDLRPPNLGETVQQLRRKLGDSIIDPLLHQNQQIFKETVISV